jgi:hypothetical protein
MLRVYRQATALTRATRGRSGNVVALDADEVLVAGDLHDMPAHLKRILAVADLDRHPRRHLVLQEVVHGKSTYPDGSDRSHRTLDIIATLKTQFPDRVHLLPGNHELSQWTGRSVMKDGRELSASFEEGLIHAWGERAEEMAGAAYEFLQSLPLALRTPNRVFLSHTVPDLRHHPTFDLGVFQTPVDPEEEYPPATSLYRLLWGRDLSEAATNSFLSMVDADFFIGGHLACEHGYQTPNPKRLIIDSSSSPGYAVLVPCDGPITLERLTPNLIRIDA